LKRWGNVAESLGTAAKNPVAMTDGTYARECLIRDLYSKRLREFRPAEKLLKTEYTFTGSRVRADMRTIDRADLLRIWEFKIFASYEGLGQVLTYLALARMAAEFARPVKGVLAAFDFQPEVIAAVEVLNLGIELVVIPPKLRLAGGVPVIHTPTSTLNIPYLTDPVIPTKEF
jgi:hypothetical protein